MQGSPLNRNFDQFYISCAKRVLFSGSLSFYDMTQRYTQNYNPSGKWASNLKKKNKSALFMKLGIMPLTVLCF